jgi:hypothetical protein
MNEIIAWSLCVIFGLLAVFQAALASGAPLGHFAWGGQHRVLPRHLRIGSVVSIATYGLFAVIALEKAGVVNLFGNQTFIDVMVWILVGYFALGIGLNALSRSKPERYTMTPLLVLLTAMYLILAL